MLSPLVYGIRSSKENTLFIITGLIIDIGLGNTEGSYPGGWKFQGHIQVVNHYHCEKLMMCSSLVLEIRSTKTVHYCLLGDFQHQVRKHRGSVPWGWKFSGSSTRSKLLPLRKNSDVILSSFLDSDPELILIEHSSLLRDYKHWSRKHWEHLSWRLKS